MNNLFAFMKRSYDAGTLQVLEKGAPLFQIYKRFTIAQVNAGATLLAAPGVGFKYRMVNARMIAVGGNVAAVTTIDILATRSASSAKLVTYATAQLTRSTPVRDGNTGTVVLADAATYTANDENTAITVGKTGADVTTATHIDVVFEYAVDRV